MDAGESQQKYSEIISRAAAFKCTHSDIPLQVIQLPAAFEPLVALAAAATATATATATAAATTATAAAVVAVAFLPTINYQHI